MPDWKPHIRSRLASLRLSWSRENEIIEELSQHLEDRWREQVAAGADPEIARQQALGDFRGAEVLGRYLAALRQSRWAEPAPPAASRPFSWEGLMSDLRTAVRGLRAAPGFTLIALVVLTLGIGATTAIFSVVDAVVLRALPFDEPDQLVAVGERGFSGKGKRPGTFGPAGPDPGDPQDLSRVQPQNYLDWVAQQRVFSSIAAMASGEGTLLEPGTEPKISWCIG
jgi:hypothetical protein